MASGYQTQDDLQGVQDAPISLRPDSIPLVCFICPKNSHFSDLSHLLTHISSKGHLHNMFQLNLSREVDADAEVALAEFETWYKQNGISALLRARKSAREQRDNDQRQNRTSIGLGDDNGMVSRHSSHAGRSNRRVRGNSKARTRRQDHETNAFNEGEILKFESDEDEIVSNGHEYHTAIHTPYVWHSGSSYSNNPNQFPVHPGGQFQSYLEDEDDSSKYETSELYSPYPPEGTPETVEDDTGALVLKGVVYPGMSGFDSATEKDRRMRNQKKDPAVLLKLEANSQLVTRVEEVLDTNLDYQRTRDVYDEPSVDGSEDDNDDAVNATRTKRKSRAKYSYTSVKRGANTRYRQQAHHIGRTRGGARSSTRKARGSSLSNLAQSNMPTRRITRSSTNRQGQLPLHGHGIHPDVGLLRDGDGELDDDQDFRTHVHTPVTRSLRRQQHERLPGLALRPGNPNAAFASPTPNFKKSPTRYSGKENSHLLIKSPSSFNPYLHTSGDSIEPSNYNPLCPQPRDGFGYRLYSTYDEDTKSTTSGFNPINSNATYDPSHMPNMTANPYHRNQSGGDDYSL
ncbi:hypothetical protein F4802DRAFT_615251 [Xylaria palmicola]|nr:hypothetical protein F4802DRAFT_615251 [Xylaria palmicola]